LNYKSIDLTVAYLRLDIIDLFVKILVELLKIRIIFCFEIERETQPLNLFEAGFLLRNMKFLVQAIPLIE